MIASDATLIGFPQAALVNDIRHMIQASGHSARILHPDDFLAGKFDQSEKFMIAVVQDLDLRYLLIEHIDQHNLQRATFVHASSWVDPCAGIGSGTVVFPFATIGYQANVGRDCMVAPMCLVAHKASVADGSLINPGAMIAGSSLIGRRCVVNARATVIDKLNICDGVVIGAGSLVTKNISVPGSYVGSPARKVK